MSYKQLYRSVNNRRIGGVAGGIAEYFNLDPTPIRLLWLLAALLGGGGFLAYIIAWIIIPEAPVSGADRTDPSDNNEITIETPQNIGQNSFGQRNAFVYIGILLILLGGFFLLRELLPWYITRFSWALLLIVVGVLLLIPRRKEPK